MKQKKKRQMSQSLRKEKDIISGTSYKTGAFSEQLTPDIDFTDEPAVQCDVKIILYMIANK